MLTNDLPSTKHMFTENVSNIAKEYFFKVS